MRGQELSNHIRNGAIFLFLLKVQQKNEIKKSNKKKKQF